VSFIALITALALGYYRPLPGADWLQRLFSPYAAFLNRNFNDSHARHGIIAWLFAVLLPVAVMAAAYLALLKTHPLLGLLASVAILYLTLRSAHFGARPEQIAAALRDRNLDEARSQLAEWQECDTDAYSATDVARVGIEATLRHAHHDLFAPIFWFVLLGPVGALFYRLAYLVKGQWHAGEDGFGDFARRAFDWLDWLPARFTASSFAIVGDFEDAVYCWRTQAAGWADRNVGIILASGAGALGVRLGEPLLCKGVLEYRPELGMGDAADADYLLSATGLIWRVLALLALLLLLLTFAHWLGS